MLKNKIWIVALFLALTMAFFGCTDAGMNDDGSEPLPQDDLTILGKDLKLEAVGTNHALVKIDGTKVTFTEATEQQGVAITFPPESDGYSEFNVFFKIIAITDKRPGLLVKNTDLSNFVGIAGDQDMRYQILDNDNDGVPGWNFVKDMEFDTTRLGITLRKDMFKGGRIAFCHQQYQPPGGNQATWTFEVLKMVFKGGGEAPATDGPNLEYNGDSAIKQKVQLFEEAGATIDGKKTDVIIDVDPFVVAEIARARVNDEDQASVVTVDKATGVVSFDSGTITTNSGGLVRYLFPTSAYVVADYDYDTTTSTYTANSFKTTGRQGRLAEQEDVDLENDYDFIKIEYEVTNLDGLTQGSNFEARLIQVGTGWGSATVPYAGYTGANQYRTLTVNSENKGSFDVQTWGAGGKKGIDIHWNVGSTKGTVDFKITKVTFTKGLRHTVKFNAPTTPNLNTVKDIFVLEGNPLLITGDLPKLENAGWTWQGWSNGWDLNAFGGNGNGNIVAKTQTVSLSTVESKVYDLYATWLYGRRTPADIPVVFRGATTTAPAGSVLTSAPTVSGTATGIAGGVPATDPQRAAAVVVEADGSGFTFTYGTRGDGASAGSNDYESAYVTFSITFPIDDVIPRDITKIDLTIQGISGDVRYKPGALLMSGSAISGSGNGHVALVSSYNNLLGELTGGSTGGPGTDPFARTFTIDTSKTGTLSGTVYFAIFASCGNSAGQITSYKISDVRLYND